MRKPATDSADAILSNLFFYGEEEEIYEVTIFEPDVLRASLPESLIHSLWQKQQFQNEALQTVDGESIKIHKTGEYNLNSGPDFLDAAVDINGTSWHGDIELHLTSKEWFAHKHHENPRYNSTVLHVTLFEDSTTGHLTRQDESLIPELVLSPLLNTPLRSLLYAHRTAKTNTLACSEYLACLKNPSFSFWLKTLGLNRLERKKRQIEKAFLHAPDLETILHKLLFAGLGYAKNTEPMLSLAQRIPLQTIRTFEDPLDIEALHLGISGLLPDFQKDSALSSPAIEYVRDMGKRFKRLNQKLDIPCMAGTTWQFFRLRPSNFPTLRIVQAASLFKPGGLLNKDGPGTLEAAISNSANSNGSNQQALNAMSRLLQTSPSSFWNTHYQFKKSVAGKSSIIGHTRIKKLLLNAIFPTLLVYAEHAQKQHLENTIFQLMDMIKPEKDIVTSQFNTLELKVNNAYISQGLHELHESYCKKGKCLNCNIGLSIVNNDLH